MLARAWNAIRARHHDVPPVVLVISPGSPRPATRCRLGHFSSLRWLPPHDDHESAELHAAKDAVKSAMNHDDLPALQAALQVSTTAILQSALQISSDAKASLSEVLITEEGLTGPSRPGPRDAPTRGSAQRRMATQYQGHQSPRPVSQPPVSGGGRRGRIAGTAGLGVRLDTDLPTHIDRCRLQRGAQ